MPYIEEGLWTTPAESRDSRTGQPATTGPEVAHMETSLIFSHRRNVRFGMVPAER